jgi:pimeloyl-ACP methyl ester carboxylesterase
MNPTLHRRWPIAIAAVGLLIFLIPAGMAFWAGSEIASPPRRKLMDYHREFLTDQAAHGTHVDAFSASDGTPCLVVSPFGSPGKRGAILRSQLVDRGLTPPTFGEITGTLVLTHGRKGRKEDYLPIAERFCAVGFRCVLPDLPGHGDHPTGTATFGLREAKLPALVLHEASQRFRFEPHPAGLMGMSMGGSVAVHAAGQPAAPWQALVVIASFDELAATIQSQASGYVGETLGPLWADATNDIFQRKTGHSLADIQPRRIAATLTIPTLIAHGTADPTIPLVSARRLFDALPDTTTKKWIEIPNADHDDVLVTDYPIYADIAEWMMLHLRDPSSATESP